MTERIARWEAWQQAFPDSAHAEAVSDELTVLRGQLTAQRTADVAPAPPGEPASLTVRFQSLPDVQRGTPLDIAVAVVEHEYVEQVRMLLRRRGDATWQTLPMRREGDFYHRLALDPNWTAAPATLEYMIEVVRTDATLEAVAGDERRPARVTVRPPPPGEAPQGHSRATLSTTFVDFNTGGEGTDRYYQVEATFTYDVGWWRLDAFQVGVGTISGEGGPVDALESGAASESLTLGYAYAEAQFGLGEWVGLSTRILGGNHHTTDDETSQGVTGFEGRVRFGSRLGTRLEVGGSLLEDVGNQGYADLFVEVFEKVPISASVLVTNLPVNADLGVRLTTGAGYRFTDHMALLGVVGWNARTIHHQGYTLGAHVALDW